MTSIMMKGLSGPDELAAWQELEAAEASLEVELMRKPSAVAIIGGVAYYLDESHRMVMAPAFVNGTPDRFNARHRSEYEPMDVQTMLEMSAGIKEWLAAQAGDASR